MAKGRPKAQYSQALRLLKIVEMLQHRRRVTIGDLMETFQINRRTVQRDIGVLNELYSIEEGERTPQGEKTFQLRPGSKTDTLRLTLTEMLALYMGRNLFAFMDGTDLKDAMDSLYNKLQTRLCARNATVREALPKKLYATSGFPKSYGASDDVLNAVLTGLIEQRRLNIRYQIPGRRAYNDTVHPYTLVLHNHALYLMCFSERAEARRVLALERIGDCQWRNTGAFEYPQNYDPQSELESAFGISAGTNSQKVRLLFAPNVAPYVQSRRWHPSMTTKVRKNGALEVALQVSVGEELLHWLTGYGPNVKILAPKSLRDAVRERHAAAI